MSGSAGDGGFFDALTSPGVAALIGAAQGFGQAAMPSRMPVPFGAVVGMGMGGALQGAVEGQKAQLTGQQARAAGMQNQAAAAELPATLGLARYKADLFSHPDKLQAFLNGADAGVAAPQPGAPLPAALPVQPAGSAPPGAAPSQAAAPDYGKINSGALSSLPDDPARRTATNAALRANLPLAAWAPWMATVHNESGWNLKAPDNVNANGTRDIGPGGLNTGTLPSLGLTEDQARDPDANLAASAGYFKQHWLAANGDPARAMAGYNTGRIDGNAPDYVGRGMARLGTWGYGPAGQPGGAQPTPAQSDAQARADALYRQANQLEGENAKRKFLNLPAAPGDPAALRAQALEYLKVAQAGPMAAATNASNLKYAGATETAKEAAKAAITPTMDRYGNMFIRNQDGSWKYLGRGSEVEHVWNPATGQMEWGDVGGIGVGALPGHGAPGSGAGAASAPNAGPPAAAPPPLQSAFMADRGKDLAGQFNKIDSDAAAAKEGNYLFDNLRNDSKSWQMGRFAEWEGDARAWLSAAAHAIGVEPKGLDKKLADYQAFLKSSGSLLRTAVHDTSSRAAVQEYNLIGETLPQPTTSEQGFSQVADQWQGANDFRLAKQKFAKAYEGHPQDFNVDFNSQVSPVSFMLNRMAQTPSGQSDMQAMLARMQATPEGRMAAKHMLQQYTFAKSRGLFDDLPTAAPGGGE